MDDYSRLLTSGNPDDIAPGCIIRPARASEAGTLSDLALRSKSTWGYSDSFLEACRDELSYTREQITSSTFRFAVADVNGECAGFYALSRLPRRGVELEALFVEPVQMRKGLGRALLSHAIRTASRIGAATLMIQSDPHAESFYRAAGGILIGWRKSESFDDRYLPVLQIDLTKHS